jgi:metallo-beta-lactamase family protein
MSKLAFYGAAGEVTGSCYVLSTDHAQVIVDMGLFQGNRSAYERNRRQLPIDIARLRSVVLTHAHLDHCGRLPLLVKQGYRGPIYCTKATADITAILLRDAARLQAEDCERFNRRLRRRSEPRRTPLYDERDVERMLPRLTSLSYDKLKEITEGVSIKFFDAGHILGAASVQMVVHDARRTVSVVFSGDIGPAGSPILRDPITPALADVVLLESTYGERDHRSLAATCEEFLEILKSAEAAGSKVIIPAFAVGRTQDIVFHVGEFLRAGELKNMEVYVDSPMAASVTDLYAQHTDLYDERANELLAENMKPLSFPGLTYTRTVEESKRLNSAKGPMVIISANGMCTGGRIRHHLYHSLPNPECQVVIVGYQSQGTVGRHLVDGSPSVRIFRDKLPVRAKIHTLGGFSAHAGQSALVAWAEALQSTDPRLFLTHGEDLPRTALAAQLQAQLGLHAVMPNYGDEVAL